MKIFFLETMDTYDVEFDSIDNSENPNHCIFELTPEAEHCLDTGSRITVLDSSKNQLMTLCKAHQRKFLIYDLPLKKILPNHLQEIFTLANNMGRLTRTLRRYLNL